MKWWKRFLRLRKQNDTVKIMLLYIVIGVCFFVNAIYNGVLLYRLIQSPVEYVAGIGGTFGTKLKELAELENVKAFSVQGEKSVTMKYKTTEVSLPCVYLSKEYLKNAYGIEESGAMEKFFVNQAAYEQLKQENTYEPDEGILRVTYTIEAQEEDKEGQKGTADIVLLADILPDKEPYAFCRGDSVDYAKSTTVRVLAARHELDEITVKRLQGMGFVIENTTDLQEDKYMQEMKLVELRYGLIVAGICVTAAGVMWRLRGVSFFIS